VAKEILKSYRPLNTTLNNKAHLLKSTYSLKYLGIINDKFGVLSKRVSLPLVVKEKPSYPTATISSKLHKLPSVVPLKKNSSPNKETISIPLLVEEKPVIVQEAPIVEEAKVEEENIEEEKVEEEVNIKKEKVEEEKVEEVKEVKQELERRYQNMFSGEIPPYVPIVTTTVDKMFEMPDYLLSKEKINETQTGVIEPDNFPQEIIKKKEVKKKKSKKMKRESNSKLVAKTKDKEVNNNKEESVITQKDNSTKKDYTIEQQIVKKAPVIRYHNLSHKSRKVIRDKVQDTETKQPSETNTEPEPHPKKHDEHVIHNNFTPRVLPIYRKPKKQKKTTSVYICDKGIFDVNWEIEANRQKIPKKRQQVKYKIDHLERDSLSFTINMVPISQANKILKETIVEDPSAILDLNGKKQA